MSDIAIRVKNITKAYQIYDKPQDRLKQSLWRGRKQFYREFKALDDVSFEVKKGETVGIIGRNGSGKSTLLQIICGTLAPTSGTVEVNGRVAALLELGAGFNPEFSGKENIYMNATILGLSKEEIDAKYEDIIAFADIGDFVNQPVKTYSSGMYVRLAFAVIAHVDADILVIDEALAVGDVFFTQKCMRFLSGFMKNGSVLFVSHDTNSILNLCQTAIWLDQGREKNSGSPKSITESYLESFYGKIQDTNNTTDKKNIGMKEKCSQKKADMRKKFINESNLRNDIELFSFSSDAAGFGAGGVAILDVSLLSKDNEFLSWVVGGEAVVLRVKCLSKVDILQPIIGFMVKNKLGQTIFAENTFIEYCNNPINIPSNAFFNAFFSFTMPIMKVGDYTIAVAVAEGTQEEHIQHQWIHDALAFKVHTSSICHGLIGVPMTDIELIIDE